MGITLPNFILQAIVEQVTTSRECLVHYPPCNGAANSVLFTGFVALGQGDRYISSQTAPNGASRVHFGISRFPIDGKALALLRGGGDKWLCWPGLIPPDRQIPHLLVSGLAGWLHVRGK